MVALGGGRGHAWDTMRYGDTINERAVRILLECILLITSFTLLYSGDQKYVVTRKMDSIVPMNKEEAIFLAKFPDGSKPEGYRRAPIEREDWPAPPEPAAAYPELCKLAVEITLPEIP